MHWLRRSDEFDNLRSLMNPANIVGLVVLGVILLRDAPIPSSVEPLDPKVYIYGRDDRVAQAPHRAIGKLLTRGGKFICNAFALKTNLFATANHCLFDDTGRPSVAQIEIWDGSRHAVRSVVSHPDASGSLKIDDVSDDVGLVKLRRPLNVTPLKLRWIVRRGAPVFLLAYHGDSPDVLQRSYCGPAKVYASLVREDRIQAQCDNTKGASGAPVLAADGRVVGIHVGNHVPPFYGPRASLAALISERPLGHRRTNRLLRSHLAGR